MPQFHRRLAIVTCLSCFSLVGWSGPSVLAVPVKAIKEQQQEQSKELVDEVWQAVNKYYVDPSFNQQDWPAVREALRSRTYRNKDEAYKAITTALKPLGDRYTRFLDPAQFARLNGDEAPSAIGIRLDIVPGTKEIQIVEPLNNSPASRAGIQPGDILVELNGKLTQGKSIEEVADGLRGRSGSIVSVVIRRKDKLETLRLTRAKIDIPSVRSSRQATKLGAIGYIRISQFASNSTAQSEAAIKGLEKDGVVGYVLDLRGNPGGLLTASVDVTRQWLNVGEIMTMKTRDNTDKTIANQTALTQKPLVVIVDGNTIAGSEVLASALQENSRAQLVGTQTFGMNVIGSVLALKTDRSGVTVTSAKWLTAKQHDIGGKGITPDAIVTLSDAQRTELGENPKLIGTEADPQFAKALEVLHSMSPQR
jgi:carboxyl-terminal processing protease